MSHDSKKAVLDFSFEIRSLVSALNAALSARFRPLGLTCVQAEALLALDDLGTASLKQLASHVVAESGHPSRLVSRMVQEGLIARTVSARDGRAVSLELTAWGKTVATQARAAREPLLADFSRRYGRRLTEASLLISEIRHDLTDH